MLEYSYVRISKHQNSFDATFRCKKRVARLNLLASPI